MPQPDVNQKDEPPGNTGDASFGMSGSDATMAPRERIFYRDADEFNKALDKASEAIRTSASPDYLGNTIWWGLVAFQAFLYIADWVFDWEVRNEIIPGVDLVKPIWIVIIGVIAFYHGWTRNRHAQILKSRLCFKCGTKLLKVEVDDGGDGVCPDCEREFNLGEYRPPTENRGRGFQGYIDQPHFDKVMYATAEQIRKSRGQFESDLLGWCWLGLGVSFGLKMLLKWDLFEWLPWPIPVHAVWLVVMLIWSWIYTIRVKRLRPGILDRRLCFICGYSLIQARTNEAGVGRCPECGSEFILAQYDNPPRGAKAR